MIEIDITGANDLSKAFEDLKLQKTLEDSISTSLLLLQREIKKVTPVDTGLMRNSWEIDDATSQRLAWRLNNFREYAPIVEHRQRFMQDGIDTAEPLILNVFNKNIDNLFKTL